MMIPEIVLPFATIRTVVYGTPVKKFSDLYDFSLQFTNEKDGHYETLYFQVDVNKEVMKRSNVTTVVRIARCSIAKAIDERGIETDDRLIFDTNIEIALESYLFKSFMETRIVHSLNMEDDDFHLIITLPRQIVLECKSKTIDESFDLPMTAFAHCKINETVLHCGFSRLDDDVEMTDQVTGMLDKIMIEGMIYETIRSTFPFLNFCMIANELDF